MHTDATLNYEHNQTASSELGYCSNKIATAIESDQAANDILAAGGFPQIT